MVRRLTVETSVTWIPLSDGTRLSVRLWRDPAQTEPQPAILEYLPYRKDDLYAVSDQAMIGYFAAAGYAGVKVDIRGTGNSEGIHEDEYSEQETVDALEVIAWIREQPWCSGNVGMFGISYGGFNSLQIAARRPPGLEAVISAGSVDDRFGQDVHRIGGCVHSDGLVWASWLLSFDGLPPHPGAHGAGWRDAWLTRLESIEPAVHTWLAHQRRDDYWRHGSVCEDYAAIECGVYMVSGWSDLYRDSVLTMLEGHPQNTKGLIGPWEHAWPQDAGVGPKADFLNEAVRWYDHWLKGAGNGIMDEPRLHAYIDDAFPPKPGFADRPGRWVALDRWGGNPAEVALHPVAGGVLSDEVGDGDPINFTGSQVTGVTLPGGACAFASPQSDLPDDQRIDEGLSLCFETGPLESPMTILGVPRLHAALSSDKPVALLAVRITDVDPSGPSTLVSYGLLNLAHRNGSEHPQPLEPGRVEQVVVDLRAIGHEIPAGHRLRLSLSPTCWPWAWPSPDAVTLTLAICAGTRLTLPMLADALEPAPWLSELEIAHGPELAIEHEGSMHESREIVHDPARGTWEARNSTSSGLVHLPARGVSFEVAFTDTAHIAEDDPLSARMTTTGTHRIDEGGMQARVMTRTSISCDATRFLLVSSIEARDGDEEVFRRTWSHEIPRDLL